MTAELADRRVGAGREKLRTTALDLFAARGVCGTSLQMIADAMGVTKAAVYHHYRSKDDIVLAVVRPALDQLVEVIEIAGSKRSRAAQIETVIAGLADVIIRNRRLYAVLQGDLGVAQVLADYSEFADLGERITRLLVGPEPDAGSLVAASILLSGLRGVGADPRVVAFSDEELHRYLIDCAHRLMPSRRSHSGAS